MLCCDVVYELVIQQQKVIESTEDLEVSAMILRTVGGCFDFDFGKWARSRGP